MKKFLICIGLALTLSACSSDHIIRFDLEQPQEDIKDEKPSYRGKSHFFFWGMWQKTDYDMTTLCHNRGIKAIDTHWTLYDSLMGGLSMGIYAPESFAIYCK